jgi:hypothetical protein
VQIESIHNLDKMSAMSVFENEIKIMDMRIKEANKKGQAEMAGFYSEKKDLLEGRVEVIHHKILFFHHFD